MSKQSETTIMRDSSIVWNDDLYSFPDVPPPAAQLLPEVEPVRKSFEEYFDDHFSSREKIHEILLDNSILCSENKLLRKRITELENEFLSLKQQIRNSSAPVLAFSQADAFYNGNEGDEEECLSCKPVRQYCYGGKKRLEIISDEEQGFAVDQEEDDWKPRRAITEFGFEENILSNCELKKQYCSRDSFNSVSNCQFYQAANRGEHRWLFNKDGTPGQLYKDCGYDESSPTVNWKSWFDKTEEEKAEEYWWLNENDEEKAQKKDKEE